MALHLVAYAAALLLVLSPLQALVFFVVHQLFGRAWAQGTGVPQIQGHDRLALAIAQSVQGEVVGDRKQPGREFCPRMVLLPAAIDAQEHFLGQVLGGVTVSHQVIEHRDQSVLITEHQLLEGGGVVFAHLEHEPDIRIAQFVVLCR